MVVQKSGARERVGGQWTKRLDRSKATNQHLFLSIIHKKIMAT